MTGGALVLVLVAFTLIGVLRFTSPAVRELSYRKGQLWYLGPSTRKDAPYRAPERPATVPQSSIRVWTLAGGVLLLAAVYSWAGLGAPLIGIIVGAVALCLLGMAAGGWRQNRWLTPPSGSPIGDIVDRGLLRFSPKVDELIVEICKLGGRDRLDGEFDWAAHPGEPPLPPEEFQRRLEGLRAELRSGTAPPG